MKKEKIKFIKKGKLHECTICKKIFSGKGMANHKKSFKRVHQTSKIDKCIEYIN